MTSLHPHPELEPLLVKYELSWEDFSRKGRQVRQRLRLAERLALGRGWQFAVWTEKDLGEWLIAEKN
jgi:hypothetical protein